MNTKRIAGVATLWVLGSCLAVAQDRGGKKGPPPQMSFSLRVRAEAKAPILAVWLARMLSVNV